MKYGFLCCSVSLLPLMATAVFAADTTDISGDVFGLGRIEQVTVTGTRDSAAIGETTVGKDQLYQYGATTLDKALELVPGVSTSTTGGTRNEKLFYIRGFDRFQSPLYVDGIRVYLPADNRLDISFFNTGDLAEIQVEKGYVSVLSGPGAIGGAI
ncbi:MAG: Plug domain-containing protein, partial [Rhizomicrobium sp.]